MRDPDSSSLGLGPLAVGYAVLTVVLVGLLAAFA